MATGDENKRLVREAFQPREHGDKVFLRFESSGVAKIGLRYEQVYCFAMMMREQRIVEIVAYLDTDLLARVFS